MKQDPNPAKYTILDEFGYNATQIGGIAASNWQLSAQLPSGYQYVPN